MIYLDAPRWKSKEVAFERRSDGLSRPIVEGVHLLGTKKSSGINQFTVTWLQLGPLAKETRPFAYWSSSFTLSKHLSKDFDFILWLARHCFALRQKSNARQGYLTLVATG